MLGLLVTLMVAHPPLQWSDKVFGAELVVEVRLSDASVTRVVGGSQEEPPKLPAKLFTFAPSSPCLKKADAADTRALIFLRAANDGSWTQLGSVEQERGPWTSLHPDYPRFVAAVARTKGWVEERMRAVSDELLWQDQRAALAQTENPYAALLAARFLEAHGAGDVVTQAWGSSGSEQRAAKERWARAALESSACP